MYRLWLENDLQRFRKAFLQVIQSKTETIHTYILISDNVRDVVDHMLLIVRNVEKEEGKDATIGLTEEHYQMIIFDIFEGNSKSGTLIWIICVD